MGVVVSWIGDRGGVREAVARMSIEQPQLTHTITNVKKRFF